MGPCCFPTPRTTADGLMEGPTADPCEEGCRPLDTVPSLSHPPRLLIAENNPALLELLPSALSQHIPGIVMDICSLPGQDEPGQFAPP